MNRDELLKKLQDIRVGVEIVIMPNEGALECTYVCSRGLRYEWISMNSWPAGGVKITSQETLEQIKEKIAQGKLVASDLEGTEFEELYQSLNGTDVDDRLSELFSGLIGIDIKKDESLYVLRFVNELFFYKDFDEFEKAFDQMAIGGVTPWEEYSTEDLQYYVDECEDKYSGIPLFFSIW